MSGLEPKGGARRFEVINGVPGRRRWSADEKARILEETIEPGAAVSAVALRHRLTPQQLFKWRREARKAPEMPPAFVPVAITPEPLPVATAPSSSKPMRRRRAKRPPLRGKTLPSQAKG